MVIQWSAHLRFVDERLVFTCTEQLKVSVSEISITTPTQWLEMELNFVMLTASKYYTVKKKIISFQ